MFNGPDRLPIVQEMILADTPEARQAALDRLLPIQREDFKGIFKAMAGLPVTVRLLDPPMHEFLPTAAQLELEIEHLHLSARHVAALDELPETLRLLDPELYRQYADGLARLQDSLHTATPPPARRDRQEGSVAEQGARAHEVNPMLGHRGVRLGISFPEIYAMQIQAMLEATALCVKDGVDVHPEIMVPQVVTVEELKRVPAMMDKLKGGRGAPWRDVQFKFGTMIEAVRACMRAGGSPRSPSSSPSAPTT